MMLWVSVSHFVSHTNRSEQQPPALNVLVSYVYFETSSLEPCELSNKRTNLAFFIHEAVFTSPPGIHFRLNFPGDVPSADVLRRSLGLDVESNAGAFFTRVSAGQIPNVHLFDRKEADKGASDLCHHWFSFQDISLEYDFFMILSDGRAGSFYPRSLKYGKPRVRDNFARIFR